MRSMGVEAWTLCLALPGLAAGIPDDAAVDSAAAIEIPPQYRLQSLHLRMIECNLDAGVQPLMPGSQSYTDLEVFLSALSNGYPVSVPAERN